MNGNESERSMIEWCLLMGMAHDLNSVAKTDYFCARALAVQQLLVVVQVSLANLRPTGLHLKKLYSRNAAEKCDLRSYFAVKYVSSGNTTSELELQSGELQRI